jgi:uncharacterized cupredoxin-like copper-binding protein
MSRHSYRGGAYPAIRLLTVGCALLALLAFGFARVSPVTAQEGSPVASPVVTGPCDAPELPPGTPTPQMQGSPEAGTPEAGVPLAPEEAASPEAEPEGTPADEATTKVVIAAAQNLVNCINSGNYEGVAALLTPNAIMQLAGTDNPYDVVAFFEMEKLTFGDFQASNVETYPDGSVSVEVTYTEGKYEYTHERWYLVADNGYWKLDHYDTLAPEPEGDTAVVGVQLGAADNEYTIIPNADSVTQTQALIFHVTNAGKEAHMMAVLKLPEGATIDQVMQSQELQNQTEFIGEISYLAPGDLADLALVNVPAGEYALICFFPAPDGKTHAEHGMVTTFTVNPPA